MYASRMVGRASVVLAAFFVSAWAANAGTLPGWTDDSGLAVSTHPQRFRPLKESTTLTGRIYHAIDVPVRVRWALTVEDPSGGETRCLTGDSFFKPGQTMEFNAGWDGRDAAGELVKDGLYRVVLDVDMRAIEGKSALTRVLQPEPGEETIPRTDIIHQQFAGFVIVDSSDHIAPGISVLSQAPHEPGFPYNYYFGTLHSQTSYSDGGHPNDSACVSSSIHGASDFDPVQAYGYARNTARLDFLGITDHNHLFNDACSGCSAPTVVARYHTGLTAAANATVDGSFVGIYGMEWGYISNPDAGFPNQGHIGVFESPKLFGWEPTSTCTVGVDCYYDVYTASGSSGYAPMYTTAMANPSAWGAFGQFNHPSDGTKSAANQGLDFNSLQYTTDGDDFIHSIAVISGPATGYSTTSTDTGSRYAGDPVNGAQYSAYTSTDMYNLALGKGFHVAPSADQDVHCSNYGTDTRDRTVILATTLTKAALFDALHHRRVYTTSNVNTQLVFTMIAGATTYYMGDGGIRTTGPVATSGSITLHTSIWDPDGSTVTSIKIKEPVPGNTNGSATVIATGTSSPFDYTFTPSSGNHAYYVYVTLNTGDELWSAPIWINQGGTPDTTPPTTSITSPASGATVSGTVSVTASASDNVGVTKVEFYLDSVLQSTSTISPYAWSWNTTTAANGSHSLTSKAYDAAANVGTSAVVSVTVSNTADTTPPTAPANLTATASKRKITLSWTASTDNVGVTGYQVWRASSSAGPFSQIVATSGTSYTDISLASGSTWYYYVKATDAAGNISAPSNTASATAR